MNVLFWNTGVGYYSKDKDNLAKKEIVDQCIVGLIEQTKCDILVLAEYGFETIGLCNKISLIGTDFREHKTIQPSRVKFLCNSNYCIELIRDNRYYAIYNLRTPLFDLLIAGTHFPSKLHSAPNDQGVVAGYLIGDMNDAQKEVGHNNAIIVGDFNANPYEDFMMEGNLLHALPWQDIVQQRKKRKIYGRDKMMYYNPMWSLWGRENNSFGTYYYDSSGAINMYWNMYDQIIISADIISYFEQTSLRIITKICDRSLSTIKGIPDKENYSDHFPIYFKLKEK
ncbi:endonuclease/exonuclease/phosphatase family protein [Diplocloster modestus]|uniref:Nuclease n=1 Tax=Diplocloster modestus TaxID=2850322 RepID=A0ABS6KC16_9FIRM|nr:nuclease [Diplocloster modestus]MBU9728054.1 nuclease [Diplocloster modestus]